MATKNPLTRFLSEIGRLGGQVKSKKKAKASRKNLRRAREVQALKRTDNGQE